MKMNKPELQATDSMTLMNTTFSKRTKTEKNISVQFHSNYFALQYRIAPQHQFRNIFPYS